MRGIARTNDDPKPYPICGATNRSGYPCGNGAGKGTNHPGVGRCKNHGGTSQTLKSITAKKGLAAAISFPGIQEEYERLQQNKDVFDLRDHIHLIEAIALTVLKSAKTIDDLPLVAKLVTDAAKTIQKLDEIEHGRKLVIEMPELRLIFEQIRAIIFRHVLDSHTRTLIGEDIRSLPFGGSSNTDQPSVERAVESGLEVES